MEQASSRDRRSKRGSQGQSSYLTCEDTKVQRTSGAEQDHPDMGRARLKARSSAVFQMVLRHILQHACPGIVVHDSYSGLCGREMQVQALVNSSLTGFIFLS